MFEIEIDKTIAVKDIVWFFIALATLWLAKTKINVAIRAMKHNANLIAYKHSLEAHHSTCSTAFTFAPEIEDHLIELHRKYDEVLSSVEFDEGSISVDAVQIDLNSDVYNNNLGNISNLNSDASNFLVSYFKFLEKSKKDIPYAVELFASGEHSEALSYLSDIYKTVIQHGIRAYVELVHAGYEADLVILKSGEEYYVDFDKRLEQIHDNYRKTLGLIKGRYFRIDAGNVIEHALGKELRKWYDDLDVTMASEEEYFSSL